MSDKAKQTGLTRRNILQSAVVATGLTVLPSHCVRGADSPNEKLNLAIIGTGGRGSANLGGVRSQNIYGLCDTNPAALKSAKNRFSAAKVTTDWRTFIDDKKIDGYVISTADHHHGIAAVAAMLNDKHVYCEKPVGHRVNEARRIQQVYKERKGKIATQMGTQIHAGSNYRRVVELVQGGAIGKIKEAHVWCSRSIKPLSAATLPKQEIPEGFDWQSWLGPAPERAYNTNYWKGGNLNWNRRWDFGNGVIGDMGSHLIDLPYWALDLQLPADVVSEGPKPDPVEAPAWQVVTWNHAARQGKNPMIDGDVKLVWYHGPEGMKRREALLQPLVGSDTKIGKWGIGVAFIGEKGVIVGDYSKHVLSPSASFKDYKRPGQGIIKSPGHYAEWLNACKGTGPEPLCNFDYSGRLIENNLLGVAAFRLGEKIEWDAKEGKVKGSDAAKAEEFLSKKYRKGWELG